MEQYILKSVVLTEIEKLVDKGKYHEKYDCAYRDGNNGALYALKSKLNTLEVKEVDLEKEIEKELETRWRGEYLFTSKFRESAKHFFELGLSVNNHITAADRGIVEEIILSLYALGKEKMISYDKEIEWLRNKVKKGE